MFLVHRYKIMMKKGTFNSIYLLSTGIFLCVVYTTYSVCLNHTDLMLTKDLQYVCKCMYVWNIFSDSALNS